MNHWQDWFAVFLILCVLLVGIYEMAFECPKDGKFYGTEIGDNVKVVTADNEEFRAIVQQFSGNVIWIVGGDLYWADSGDSIGASSDNIPKSRLEHATLDELDPLLDVSFLA